MAYRRSLSTRATLIARACNNPSFSYIIRDHHERHNRDSTLSRQEFNRGLQLEEFRSARLVLLLFDVVSDATTTQENEVAIADSSWPVTVLQHFIDSVHNFTGLNCRIGVFLIYFFQVTFKHFEMLEDKDMDPEALADGQKQMQKAHEECCIPLPRISVLIDGLSFSISAEVTMQEFMKVDHDDDFMKIISRCVAVLLVSATMDCPKAICCYLITSNLVPLAHVQVILHGLLEDKRKRIVCSNGLSAKKTHQTGKGVLQFSLGSSAGSAFCQYMSTTVGEGSDKIELMSDVADVLTDATTQVVANHAPACTTLLDVIGNILLLDYIKLVLSRIWTSA
ncbi:hypothetical protein Q3G72_035435 [Acer saccharum]|nr:hypothetical protein Q3G72_035435 [Acer saccharum]